MYSDGDTEMLDGFEVFVSWDDKQWYRLISIKHQ